MSLNEEDDSRLYYCYFVFFKGTSAYLKYRFYRANSENEAYGAFIKFLNDNDITPESIDSKWCPSVTEIDPESFIDVRD